VKGFGERVCGGCGEEWDVVSEDGSVGVWQATKSAWGSVESDGALVYPEDLVGDGEGFWDIVRDDEGGEAASVSEIENLLKYGVATDGVESCGGFVEEDEFGVSDEGAGNGDAFLHASGEFGGVARGFGFEFEGGECFCDALRVLFWWNGGLSDEWEADISGNGEKIEQGVVLKDVAAFRSKTAQCFRLVEGSVLVGEGAGVGLE
jgi:hypothetical protein